MMMHPGKKAELVPMTNRIGQRRTAWRRVAERVTLQVAFLDSVSSRVCTDYDGVATKKAKITASQRIKEEVSRIRTIGGYSYFTELYENKARPALQNWREKQNPHAGELR
jgi:hypothetical protein